jgi:tight adherence protein C
MRTLTLRRRPGSRLFRRRDTSGVPAEAIGLAADLLAVAVAAGLTPYLALQVGARFATGAAGSRLEAVIRAAEGGERLADALDAESARTPGLAPLLAVLANSERSGAPAGPSLTRLAVSVRAQARRRAMARARTVPVRLLFPLVFLVLPAFLVLTVAPVVLAGLNPR